MMLKIIQPTSYLICFVSRYSIQLIVYLEKVFGLLTLCWVWDLQIKAMATPV